MAQQGGLGSGGSLTRKSKKDDVEALLSDFDKLDAGGAGASSNASAPTPSRTVRELPSSSLTGQALKRKAGDGGSASNLTTAAGSTSSAKNDAAQSLLDDLDDLVKQRRAPTPKKTLSSGAPPASEQSATSISPPASSAGSSIANRRAQHNVRSEVPAYDSASPNLPADSSQPLSSESLDTSSGAGVATASASPWGSWWSSATKLADQARAELEKRAAQVQTQVAETTAAAAAAAASRVDQINETGFGDRGGGGGDGSAATDGAAAVTVVPWQLAQNVNSFLKSHGGDLNKIRNDLGKVGMKRWNEILNVVVPPIESHEVLSITLSHDMVGFEGVPDVVFQVLQRVMEAHASSQNAEQQIVVNKAPERTTSKAAPEAADDAPATAAASAQPDLCPVAGLAEAWKLAESRLDELVQIHNAATDKEKAAESDIKATAEGAALPITTCPLFVRIQPVVDQLPGLPPSAQGKGSDEAATHLFLAVVLRDPTNNLTHRTLSQPLLKSYALLPFEENPWAEDLLSDSLQAALGSVGLEYVRSRMQAQSEALSKAAAADASSSGEGEHGATPAGTL